MVLSQITTRFDAPIPVTYALIWFVFALACIKNIRSDGIGIPAFSVSLSIDSTSSGCFSSSGSNLLNIGSITHGAINTRKVPSGIAANQKYSHQVSGFHRITAARISATTSPKPIVRSSVFVQSQNQGPQPSTDC